MADIVIGYRSPFYEELRTYHQIEPQDLVGAKFELKFARIVSETKLKTEEPDDIIDQLITNNVGVCTEFDYEKNESIVMLEHEVPLEIFKKYYTDTPILKDGNI